MFEKKAKKNQFMLKVNENIYISETIFHKLNKSKKTGVVLIIAATGPEQSDIFIYFRNA